MAPNVYFHTRWGVGFTAILFYKPATCLRFVNCSSVWLYHKEQQWPLSLCWAAYNFSDTRAQTLWSQCPSTELWKCQGTTLDSSATILNIELHILRLDLQLPLYPVWKNHSMGRKGVKLLKFYPAGEVALTRVCIRIHSPDTNWLVLFSLKDPPLEPIYLQTTCWRRVVWVCSPRRSTRFGIPKGISLYVVRAKYTDGW